MKPQKPIAILSACIEGNDEQTNKALTESMAVALGRLGIAFKPVEGIYQGVSEDSFLVQLEHENELVKVLALAWTYDQESVLIADDYRFASLVFPDGSSKALGKLRVVQKDELSRTGDYTYDAVTDQYFQAG